MMKNLTLLFAAILLSLATVAQAPASPKGGPMGINYQTVIRDGDGNILPYTELSLQMTIRSGSADGEVVYAETHDVNTNAFGLVNLVIGYGIPQNNAFSDVIWGNAEKYLETAIDLDRSGSYTIMGVTQFLSVPYAFESNHSRSITLMDENGNEYEVSVDTLGNLFAGLIIEDWVCGNPFTDTRDGKSYETVQIGDQCWMSENLAYLPEVSPSSQGNNTDPYFYVYDYHGSDVTEAKATTNYQTYGVLYNWPSSLDACLANWHLPADAEWTVLTTYLGGESVAGGKMKETGTSHWNSPNTGATNSSGFTGLPGGYRPADGTFSYLGINGVFWSSTEYSTANAWNRFLSYNIDNALGNHDTKGSGYSVRCLRDVEQQNLPPESPSSPSPENESQNQGIETGLSWTCTDPDGDPLTYDVFFGIEATPAQVATGQSETTFDPGTLEYDTQYFWQIVAHDNHGNTTEGAVWSFTTQEESVGFNCGDTFTDIRDGQSYETVQIGDQCWMSENLAYLPEVSPSSQGNNTDPYYYVYDYQGSDVTEAKATTNYQTYGVLYNWPSSLDACPANWHLPADVEWTVLTTYLGGESVAGGKMKETGTSHWNSPNTGATNSSGFTGLPGGYRPADGTFSYLGISGNFWSSTEYSTANAWNRFLSYNIDNALGNHDTKGSGNSVRCLRDVEQQNLPPESPSSPSPENESQNQGIETGLSWTCTDPDGDPLTYDVFFGIEATPAQVATGQSETTFDPGTLEYDTQYFWQIVAHDNHGNTTEGAVWSFTTQEESVGFNCGDTFTDIRDGQSYETVLIGEQCWMTENLAYLPEVSPSSDGNNTDSYYYVYDYQGSDVTEAKATANYQTYGVLYNWPSSLDACPANWHLPADAEWTTLITYLGGTSVAGGKMKETGTTHWYPPNTGVTNSSGFTGLPGGFRNTSGSFNDVGNYGYFWSSTETSTINAWCSYLYSSGNNANRGNVTKGYGFSVRCLRDVEQQNLPPESPSSPSPENESQNQGIETGLSWTCTDPDGDPLTYDVFFGIEATPAQVATGQSETTFDPGTLEYNTQYFWQIVAHDNHGNTTEGVVWSFTTQEESVGFNCGDTFTDIRDGQSYETLLIGEQCWMTENLAYLPEVSPSSDGNNTDPYYYVYDYQGSDVTEAKVTTNYQTYGVLYNWPSSLDACPANWHLPADAEWTVLITYLGGTSVAGGKMKETGTTHWNSPNTGATNSSGFTGLPGGYRTTDGTFTYIGSYGEFWSSSEYSTTNAWALNLYYGFDDAYRFDGPKGYGFSVRCLRD